MDILDAIFLRAPCREFTGEPIPDETLEAILEGARWGPSAMNVHNHRTVVVRDPETKELLASNMQEISRAFNRFATAGHAMNRLWWIPEELRPAVVEQSQRRAQRESYLAKADTLLLAFANPNWFDTLGVVYEAIGTVTTMKAFANMWTAATALGVGASFHVTSFADPRRQEILLDRLNAPHDWKLLGVLALGMPKHRSRVRAPKAPVETIAFEDYWGRPWRRVAFRDGAPNGRGEPQPVDAIDAIRLRRSARGFKTGKEGHVPDWKIEVLLEAARCAPSVGNMQPFRFLVIRDPETKRFIGQCGRESGKMVFGAVPWEEVANRMWYVPEPMHPRVLEMTTSGELFAYPEQASAIIIPLCNVKWIDMPITLHDPTPFLISLAMAIQNMWLATTALGIGIGYNGLPFIDLRKRGQILNRLGVPDGWLGNWTLNIGVLEHRRMAGPPRWPLEVVAFDEQWGRPYRRMGFRERAAPKIPEPTPEPVPAPA